MGVDWVAVIDMRILLNQKRPGVWPARRSGTRRGWAALWRRSAPRQTLEVRENGGHKFPLARILRRQGRGIEPQQIARLFGCLRPGRGRCSDELRFERGLALTQGLLVGLHVGQQAPERGGLLGRPSPALVEI